MPKMMRRDKTVATTGYMLSPTDIVANPLKTRSYDLPRLPVVVPFEVPNVLQKNKQRTMLFQNCQNLMEECATRLIVPAFLRSRLREWLARESRAQNVVSWNFLPALPDVAVNLAVHLREVLQIQFAKLIVDLAREDTLMSEESKG
jgi:hypothetical protein